MHFYRRTLQLANSFRKMKCLRLASVLLAASVGVAPPALAQFTQQGAKLVGTGAVGTADQGGSVALSADGNTAIVGGPFDNSGVGAAWVFTRSAGAWTQQAKLVGTGKVGSTVYQGTGVALSADGNTAIVGGPYDNSNIGAAWVFTQSGGVWTQQAKLVGTGGSAQSEQGLSVALSADGNTAIVGGPYDNSNVGAAWVFTRSSGVWTQQGSKLVGSGAVGAASQGTSVALSANGNTAVVGGPNDNSDIGAAWVFYRIGDAWTPGPGKLVGTGAIGNAYKGMSVALSGNGTTAIVGGPWDNSDVGAAWVFTLIGGFWQQQAKLVSSDAVAAARQGTAVALSADGNTAIVGGPIDNNGYPGAAWLFTRSGGVWTQQGSKLVGTGGSAQSDQGYSVALAADGNTAIVGGLNDNSSIGAAWVFVRAIPTNTHDFNDDGYSDILWTDSSGDLAIWLMTGTQILSGVNVAQVPTVWSVVGQRDFNGDGYSDILWRDTSGNLAIWLMDGGQSLSRVVVAAQVPTIWSVVGTGDFNGDGFGDILWRDTSGDLAMWFMNGTQVIAGGVIGTVPTVWTVVGTGDFNGDGYTDILWRDTSGDLAIWLMNGGQMLSAVVVGTVPTTWSVVGTGDFNGDGKADILWRDTSGDLAIWLMNGTQMLSGVVVATVPTVWSVAETGDFNGDGKSDILWTDSSGDLAIWLMNGTQILSGGVVSTVPTAWTVQGTNAD